jgi:hypothetical protein
LWGASSRIASIVAPQIDDFGVLARRLLDHLDVLGRRLVLGQLACA